MQVQDIMTAQVTCCAPDANVQEIARQMVACDCGSIPVIDPQTQRAVGIVTDRDIVCRAVAEGRDLAGLRAQDVMTTPVATVPCDASVEDCLAEMEASQIRRMLVTDRSGRLCGLVAQADVALKAPEHETAELVKDVSQRADHASNVH
jgi:CBS domain-containing protein